MTHIQEVAGSKPAAPTMNTKEPRGFEATVVFGFTLPDIVFQDFIQRLEGIDNFKAMCNRLTKRCKELLLLTIKAGLFPFCLYNHCCVLITRDGKKELSLPSRIV